MLFVPALRDRIEAPLSRLARWGPKTGGDGFWSGAGVGAALGFVYAPCAGPILAAVITVGAATGRTVVIGAAYAIGSAVVLLALALVGRRLLTPLRRENRMGTLQKGIGAVMVLTAVAMALQLDIRFQEQIARHLPGFLVDPAQALEKSDAVQSRLADLRGKPRFSPQAPASTPAAAAGRAGAGGRPSDLAVLGTAPEFTGTQRWFNTPGGRPLTLAELRGKVVLVDFWTYTCINCIRTLPYLKAWYAKYHAARAWRSSACTRPSSRSRRTPGTCSARSPATGSRYPVVQDNDLATWQAYGNQAWPAEYLIDARGRVRDVKLGEGGYDEAEANDPVAAGRGRRQGPGRRGRARGRDHAEPGDHARDLRGHRARRPLHRTSRSSGRAPTRRRRPHRCR